MKYLLTIFLGLSLLTNANISNDINLLIKKSDAAYNTNIDSVGINLGLALTIAKTNNLELSELDILIKQINLADYQGNFTNGLSTYKEAVTLATKLNDNKALARIYIAFAPLYEKIGSYDEAIALFIKSVGILNKLPLSEEKFKVFADLSKIFLLKENLNKSLEYSKLSLLVAEHLNEDKLLAGANFSLGNIYLQLNLFKESLVSYKKSLEYFTRINNRKNIAQTYNNIGLVNQNLGDYQEAEKNFNLAYDLAKKIHYLALEKRFQTDKNSERFQSDVLSARTQYVNAILARFNGYVTNNFTADKYSTLRTILTSHRYGEN
jgi:tetratricopeptide (TPR) repeat protein